MAAMRATDAAVRRVSRPGRGSGRLGSVIVAAGGSAMAVIGYRPVVGRHRYVIKLQSTPATPRRKWPTRDRSISRTDQSAAVWPVLRASPHVTDAQIGRQTPVTAARRWADHANGDQTQRS